MKSESYVIRKERCPECAKLGKDRGHDNLAVYSDGHSYCYSCGYHSGSGLRRLSNEKDNQSQHEKSSGIYLPSDVTTELPYEARQWLNQYELSSLDIKKHLLMWSPWWERLVFPYFGADGELLAWQGRYFGKEKKAKWFSQGKIHEIIHPINVTNREAVIVEDIVSAIKVSKIKGAIPLFGSKPSKTQLLGFKMLLDRAWYWQDPDLRSTALKSASMLNLMGIDTKVIFSDNDPKEESYEFIKEALQVS